MDWKKKECHIMFLCVNVFSQSLQKETSFLTGIAQMALK